MVTWDDSNIEKSINSDNEQVNICLMAYIDKKVKHSNDKSGIGLEKEASSSKAQFDLDKCDFYNEVILEFLKTLFVEEEQRHNAEKATMMDIDEMKNAQMEELERVQSAAQLAAQIFSPNVVQRQAKIKVATVPEEINLAKREALEEAILQSVIEASFVEENDEQLFATQSDTTNEDELRRLEEIYIAP
ncbi:hypothetical protein JHK85_039882 [Glycine max]|nr:hypothetical protein JHK85_039882 [Glycine max]